MLRRAPPIVLAALLAAACSSSSGGGSGPAPTSTTVNGTLGGRTLSPAYAVAFRGAYDTAYPGIVSVYIANHANLCALIQQLAASVGTESANLLDLTFTLGATTATSTVVPGTYTPAGMPAELDDAEWDSFDGSCHDTPGPGATHPSVTVTAVGSTYSGTFDLTFGTEHVTGSFVAPLCELPAGGQASDAGSPDGGTCLP